MNKLPTSQDAYQEIWDNIHAQVFLDKCAANGHLAQTVEEMQSLFQLAGELKAAAEIPQIKAAQAQNNVYAIAVADLQTKLAALRPNPQVVPAVAIKQAAAHYATNPSIYNAVLRLKADQADQMAAAPVA